MPSYDRGREFDPVFGTPDAFAQQLLERAAELRAGGTLVLGAETDQLERAAGAEDPTVEVNTEQITNADDNVLSPKTEQADEGKPEGDAPEAEAADTTEADAETDGDGRILVSIVCGPDVEAAEAAEPDESEEVIDESATTYAEVTKPDDVADDGETPRIEVGTIRFAKVVVDDVEGDLDLEDEMQRETEDEMRDRADQPQQVPLAAPAQVAKPAEVAPSVEEAPKVEVQRPEMETVDATQGVGSTAVSGVTEVQPAAADATGERVPGAADQAQPAAEQPQPADQAPAAADVIPEQTSAAVDAAAATPAAAEQPQAAADQVSPVVEVITVGGTPEFTEVDTRTDGRGPDSSLSGPDIDTAAGPEGVTAAPTETDGVSTGSDELRNAAPGAPEAVDAGVRSAEAPGVTGVPESAIPTSPFADTAPAMGVPGSFDAPVPVAAPGQPGATVETGADTLSTADGDATGEPQAEDGSYGGPSEVDGDGDGEVVEEGDALTDADDGAAAHAEGSTGARAGTTGPAAAAPTAAPAE